MQLVKLLAILALLVTVGPAQALEVSTQIASPPTIILAGELASLPVAAPHAIQEPASAQASPDYLFSITASPEPAGWVLLLGALFIGGFIVRRRLAD